MKYTFKPSTTIIIGIIIIIIVAVTAWHAGRLSSVNSSSPFTAVSTTTTGGISSTVKQKAVSSSKSPANVTATPGTYQNYIQQYYATKNSCDIAAMKQANELYGNSIGSSALLSYYNPTTGICFVEITGSIQPVGSATTTNIMYFRNVSGDTLLADCSQISSKNNAPGPWQCVNRANGQAIDVEQFNALISTFASQ